MTYSCLVQAQHIQIMAGAEACGNAGWRDLHQWENSWRKGTKRCQKMEWREEKGWGHRLKPGRAIEGITSREMSCKQHQWGEWKANTPVKASHSELDASIKIPPACIQLHVKSHVMGHILRTPEGASFQLPCRWGQKSMSSSWTPQHLV